MINMQRKQEPSYFRLLTLKLPEVISQHMKYLFYGSMSRIIEVNYLDEE